MIIQKIKKPLVYSLLFTLLSILMHGYSYGIGDQAIHIPLIYKLANPTFYTQDILFSAGQQNLSIFYRFYAFLMNNFSSNLEVIFFISYLITNFLLYFAIYSLAKKFSLNIWQIIIAGLFFLIPFHIAGSATFSIETSYVPRGLSFALSLWSIYFLINRQQLRFLCGSLLVFLIHPLTFVYLIAISLVYLIVIKKKISKKMILVFSFTLIVSLIILTNFSQKVTSLWLEIVKNRNYYAFLDLWSLRQWIVLLILILPSLFYLYKFKKENKLLRKLTLTIIIASSFLLCIQLIFTVISTNIFIIKLQLSRTLIFCYLISAFIVSSLIRTQIQKMIILIAIAVILVVSISEDKKYHLQESSWIDVQKWVSVNTPKNCIFLTPFYNQGFRVFSQRPIVAEYKDGTLSFYSYSFASSWNNRKNDLENIDFTKIDNLIEKYGVNYVVEYNSINIPLKKMYDNSAYSVYVTHLSCQDY